jgi:4-hydroxybenzoate polyprenyltransferase
MELDQLKEMWSDVGQSKTSTYEKELQSIIQKRSMSPIAKMKRNLFIEMVIVVVLYTLSTIYYFMNFNGPILSVAWLMLLTGVLFMIYYFFKRKLLTQMECVTGEVKTYLQLQVKTLEKYIRLYLVAGTLMFPFVMITAGIIIFLFDPKMQQNTAHISFWPFFLLLIAVSFVLTIPMYFLNKWYVRKLYGQHAEKLKKIVSEMSEEED